MPQLTLCFKEKIIDIFHLDEKPITIGRDEDNTFVIDSLAIAPKQLKVSTYQHKFIVESLSEQFPIFVNGEEVSKIALHQNDQIILQKHMLIFSDTNIDLVSTIDRLEQPVEQADGVIEFTMEAPLVVQKTNQQIANLQVISGANIGRVTPLNKAMTEINTPQGVSAIIAKRPSGYYISRLIDDASIKIDGANLTNELLLNDGSLLSIDGDQFAFFIEE